MNSDESAVSRVNSLLFEHRKASMAEARCVERKYESKLPAYRKAQDRNAIEWQAKANKAEKQILDIVRDLESTNQEFRETIDIYKKSWPKAPSSGIVRLSEE